MSSIVDKLNLLKRTKDAIRSAIISKGVSVPSHVKFKDYPTYILLISNETTSSKDIFDINVSLNELQLINKESTTLMFKHTISVEIENNINIQTNRGSEQCLK